MQFHKIVEERKSIRDFKEKNLEAEAARELLNICNHTSQLLEGIETSFHYIEDGEKVFQFLKGNVGYHGMAIKAPHYLVLTSEKKEDNLINAGYMMEQVLLNAFQNEIGSCWIDILQNQGELKEKLGIEDKSEIVALAAIGYPKTNIFGIETSVSDRHSIEELVYLKKWGQIMDLEDLEQRGLDEVFYYVRHAPSWGNTQPWRFILDDSKLLLTIEKENIYIEDGSKNNNHELDSGIIMLYIEKMMHQQGITGYWNLDVDSLNNEKSNYNMPDNQIIMGWYPI